MNATITELVMGWANSALRLPTIYGRLSCGHSCDIPIRQPLSKCVGCGVVSQDQGWCACGKWHREILERPDHHDTKWHLRAVGDEIACEACDQFAAGLVLLAEIAPSLHHTRADRYGNKIIHCYRLDESSPSGFMIAMSIEDRPEVEAILRGGLSPLSPTEAV